MKELEEENRRLKRTFAKERMKAEIVSEALEKVVRPSRRREMAKRTVVQFSMLVKWA